MKKTNFLLLLLFLCFTKDSFAQNQSWLLGCGTAPRENIVIDFTKNVQFPPFILKWDENKYRKYAYTPRMTNNVLTDDKGNIKIAYSGYFIGAMPYMDTSTLTTVKSLFKYSSLEQHTDKSNINISTYGNKIVLPHTTNPNQYHVISSDTSITEKGKTLYYSLVDLTDPYLNNTQSQILIKRKKIVNENFEQGGGGLAVCKHPNGKDWWLLLTERNKTDSTLIFHRYIVKDNDIIKDGIQKTNYQSLLVRHYFGTQATYSPDGNFFVRFDVPAADSTAFEVFNFDRCKGEVDTKSVRRFQADDLSTSSLGAKFSPDSKLLYMTTGKRLLQYELATGELITIATKPDEVLSCFSGNCEFQGLELGPDGKIYMISRNKNTLSVIFEPNKKGLACNFAKDSLKLPSVMCSNILPNHPNYKLGKIECAIATKDLHLKTFSFYPNPANDQINIQSDLEYDAVNIYSIEGRLMQHSENQDNTLDISSFSAGLYFFELSQRGKAITQMEKFVKIE